MRIILLSLLLVLVSTSSLLAIDVAPRISDREIIEKLASLQEGQASTNQRFDDMNKRFDDMNKRIDDMQTSVNKRFDTLQWMLGLFVTVSLVMMGMIMKMLWQQERRITATETTLETQKDEIAFLKSLVEKLLPPRGVL